MKKMIGGHVSASGGLDKAVERAAAIGGNMMQVFSGSPRIWARKALLETDYEKMFAKMAELSVESVITHSLYLVNLASENSESIRKSTEALIFDLHFDSHVKGLGIVVHLGSHQGRGFDAVKDQLVTQIAYILEQSPTDSTFLIENSAGQNGKLCSDLADIRWLMDQVNSPRLGWCLDTCHAFAAGYEMGELELVNGQLGKLETRGSLVAAIEQYNLWDSLKCIHVNDSKDPFASGRDRHENLGDGNIPTQWLETFLNTRQLAEVPLILEVPGLAKEGPDAENVERLRRLVHST